MKTVSNVFYAFVKNCFCFPVSSSFLCDFQLTFNGTIWFEFQVLWKYLFKIRKNSHQLDQTVRVDYNLTVQLYSAERTVQS